MKTLLLSLLFFLPAVYAAEGVSVQATVDRNQVGPGDVIHLTVSVSAQDSVNVEQPNLPPLSGFENINTSSSTETRSTFTNGKFQTAQSRNFIFMLAVNQKGVLSIPPISVTVDGKTYRTQEIKISATNARATPPPRQQKQGQDPFEEMDDMEELFNQMLQHRMAPNAPGQQAPGQRGGGQAQPPVNADEAFFVSAEADKTKAVVGEQITVNFYLYTRGQIRDIDTLKYPDLHGFWKEEIEMATRLNFEQAVVNGVAYQRALLVSYALFPIKAGKSTIDPYKAKCTVLTPSAFGFGRPYQFTKASRPIVIDVEDIPIQNRPANFSGAVGHFRVAAKFEPPTGSVNQPVTLRVRFEGQGNAKLIELPKLDLPPSFELYDQKNKAQYLKDGTSFKEFEILIIPRQPGVFDVPPVASAIFDPQAKKFTEAASQPLRLSVTGSATTPAAPTLPGVAAVGTTSEPAAAKPEDELPALVTESAGPVLSASVLNGVTAAIYFAVFGLLGFRAYRSLRGKPKSASLTLVLNRRLKTVRELAGKNEWRKLGVELTNTLYYILGQISEQGGANLQLERLLEKTPPSLRSELSAPIGKLVSQCEALSFAPEKMIIDLTEKTRLEKLIVEFESVMKRAIDLAET